MANPRYTALMEQLQEQLKVVSNPFGVPVHRGVEAALNLIAKIFTEIEAPDGPIDPNDFESIKRILTEFSNALKANDAQDKEDRDKLDALIITVEHLSQQLNELDSRFQREIATKITTEQAQKLIQDSLVPFQQTDLSHAGEIDGLKHRVSNLENGDGNGGISEARAREIAQEELAPLKADLKELKDLKKDLGPRVSVLEQKVEALERKTSGEGLSETEVRRIIQEEIEEIRAEINGLLADKADKTDLNKKADTTALTSLSTELNEKIATKADQTALNELDARLGQKADTTALTSLSTALNEKIATKADQTALDELNSRIGQKADTTALTSLSTALNEKIATKADQTALNELDSRLGQKADTTALTSLSTELKEKIALKADQTALNELDSRLGQKADTTALTGLSTELNEKIALKADQTALDELDSRLGQKADTTALTGLSTELNEKIALKADQTALDELDSRLGQKADTTALTGLSTELKEKIALKADQTALDELNSRIGQKADTTALTSLSTELNEKIALKADQTALDELDSRLGQKADTTALTSLSTELNEKIALKADQTALDELDSRLGQKADQTTLSNLDEELNSRIDLKADTTALNQLASDIDDKLALKANQTEITRLELEIAKLDLKWLRDGQNSPDICLARVCLDGWGIVGGFDIYSDENDCIHISPGIGITPDGTLLIEPGLLPTEEEPSAETPTTKHLHGKEKHKQEKKQVTNHCQPLQADNLLFSHYQPFEEASYSFFNKPGKEEKYEVWKLIPPVDPLPASAHPLTPQTELEYESPFIADKIILLYYDGKLQQHYLLMRRQDVLEKLCCLPHQCKTPNENNADYLYEEDYSNEDDYISDNDVWACLHPADRLPELSLFRFGYFTEEDCEPEELDITSFPDLKTIDDFYKTWKPIIENAIAQLEKAAHGVIKSYHATLFPLLDKELFLNKLTELSQKWTRFTVSNDPPQTSPSERGKKYYAQYFYDWLRDLMAAYHELRWELIALMNELRPYSAPMLEKQHRHLLLGPAQQADFDGIDAPLRDYFHQAPVFNDNAKRLETCRLYYRRLFEMIDCFYLENYAPNAPFPGYCYRKEEDGAEVLTPPNMDQLRITPGKSYIHPLSEQAIPFYYPILDHPQSLQHYWNHRRSKNRSTDRLLSYHAVDSPPDFPSYTQRKEIIRPLHFSLDANDFYRIEGHIGKSCVRLYPKVDDKDQREYDVYDALQYLVRKYNLDFKVLRLKIADLQKPTNGMPPYHVEPCISLEETAIAPETAQSYVLNYLGAEHLGGVPKGGTFILICEDLTSSDSSSSRKKTQPKVGAAIEGKFRYIGDFSLPYAYCPDSTSENSDQFKAELLKLRMELLEEIKQIEGKIQALEAEINTTNQSIKGEFEHFVNQNSSDLRKEMIVQVNTLKEQTERLDKQVQELAKKL